MARRNYSPNKAAKEKENFEILTDSVNNNNYLNYITHSNERVMDYNYRKNYKDDYDYIPRLRKDFERKYKPNEDSYLEDYTTSAISYGESIKKSHVTSPQSKSEYGQRRRHDNRKSNRRHSPVEDYDYFNPRDSTKKRSKRTNSDTQNLSYQYETEKDIYKKSERRSRSPTRRNYYEDYILDEPEEKYDFEKYFEKAMSKDKKAKKYKNEEKAREIKKRNNSLNDYQRKDNDYKVFSYKEPRLHEKIFRPRGKVHEDNSLNSEIEIGNIDYPVLAFKDNVAQDKSSDMVYLPIIVFDKKSKSQGSPKQGNQSSQQKNMQVFAANLKDKNIFTFAESSNRNEQQVKDPAVSELQTEESLLSRDIKLKKGSNVRTSTETQTEESLIFNHKQSTTQSSDNTIHGSNFQKAEETQTDDSLLFQPNRPKYQGYNNAGSILGSIMDRVELKSKFKDSRSSKGTKKYEPSIKNKKLFAYQIDVDIEPVKNNVYPSAISKKSSISLSKQFEYKQIEDSLHDDYPVTKDYIKVADNSSEKIKANISQLQGTQTRTPVPTNLISKTKPTEKSKRSCSTSKENKRANMTTQNYSSHQDKFVIKDIPEAKFSRPDKYISDYRSHRENMLQPKPDSKDDKLDETFFKAGYVENPPGLESKNVQVFRSIINNYLRRSTVQSLPKKKSQIDSNRRSVLSQNRNIQGEEFQSKEEISTGERLEGDPEIHKGRMSVGRQQDSRILDRKSQSAIRESIINKSITGKDINEGANDYQNRNTQPSVKKNQSVIRESEVGKQNVASDLNEDANARQTQNKERLTKSQTDNLTKPSIKKSILRTTLFAKRKSTANKEIEKPVQTDNTIFQEERVISPHYLEPKEERNSLGRESGEFQSKEKISEMRPSTTPELKSKYSKWKFSRVFSPSKSITGSEYAEPLTTSKRESDPLRTSITESGPLIKSTRESGPLRKSKRESGYLRTSTREPYRSISGAYIGPETKPEVEPPEENEINKKASRGGFSRFFSRSKSRIGSKTNLSLAEENQSLTRGSRLTSLQKGTRRSTPNRKKSKGRYSDINQLPHSKSPEKVPSQISKKKSKSKTWSFLRRSKVKPETSTTEMMPWQQQQTIPPPSEVSSDIIAEYESEPVHENKTEPEDKNKTEPEDKNKTEFGDTHEKENENKGEKPCKCVVQFVKQARECSNFFLGTTLHEQIMDVLKVI